MLTYKCLCVNLQAHYRTVGGASKSLALKILPHTAKSNISFESVKTLVFICVQSE